MKRLLLLALCAVTAGACSADEATGTIDDVVTQPDTASDAGSDASEPADQGTLPTDEATPPTDEGAPPTDESNPADPEWEHVWDIGPGQTYEDPSQAPWETLQPSTLVRIHHRAEPYAHKWVINVSATEEAPVRIEGLPDADGQLPVVTGQNAVTRQELDYWNEERSVIKLGGSSSPDNEGPAWVTIANLEVRSAFAGYGFTDDKGESQSYADNAAAIHIEKGDHLTIEGCSLHDSGNGLFAAPDSSALVVRGNHIWGNGNVGSAFEHNSYLSARGILYENNRYGKLRPGADGNNLKDRSAAMVVRYNWIEGGNRQLDLVETAAYANGGAEGYDDAFVYGNLLIEPEGEGNSQIIHWGGDSGDTDTYRKGTLHLFHNTIVSTRSGNTTLIRLSSEEQSADVRNNIIHGSAAKLAMFGGMGTVTLRSNWLTSPWVHCHCDPTGSVTLMSGFEGQDPGFANLDLLELMPTAGKDEASPLADAAAGHPVVREYVVHQGGKDRASDGSPDLGAFEQPQPPLASTDLLGEGVWLLGWHGGLDHFSWARFEATDAAAATVTFMDPTGNGALTPWLSCEGAGTWTPTAPSELTIEFPALCAMEPTTYTLGPIYSQEGWPVGPTLSTGLSPAAEDTGTMSAYQYPASWCNAGFTECDPPW